MSLFSQPAWQRFDRSTSGKIGLILTVALVFSALLAPLLHSYDAAVDRDYLLRLAAPSAKHWFGTDGLGRDLLVRVWHGLGISLLVSVVSVSAGLFLGAVLGLFAGYFRGPAAVAICTLADILLAFPSILLAIAVVTVTGPSLQSVIIAVSAVQIPIYIRLTRSMVLSLREQEFVLAVKALGASDLRIIFRHILPGSLAPLVVQATLSIGTATLEAAGLGFLGLGAQPPAPELGTMLSDAFKGGYALSSPWTILFPGLLITLTVLGFNLLGDGLRDVLDPREN
ncbi:ABC transporter permease [Microcoleus sp. LEGE 07076]|uniref:ABC transporter permease n=1 Tax=Microcoleus sp. LEGE 07076 TaxID=915322 RepID=UPI0018808823|nr:ABC transporter permease [Microcoleus sp. LEGE 07076]MBE9186446.1 ABC transporter permease [Microcoleus sp. LEGE 07076]